MATSTSRCRRWRVMLVSSGAEKEAVHPVAVVGHGVDEVQKHARVAAHGARHVTQHYQRRQSQRLGAGAALERHHVAAGAEARRGGWRACRDAPTQRIGPEAPRRHRLDRQPKRRDRALGLGQFVRRHVLEVHLLQNFLGGEGEHGVELDLDVLLCFVLLRQTGRDGLAGPAARRRRLRLGQTIGCHDRPRHCALHADFAPEQPERLVEEVVLTRAARPAPRGAPSRDRCAGWGPPPRPRAPPRWSLPGPAGRPAPRRPRTKCMTL